MPRLCPNHVEEPVALSVHLPAVVGGERLAQDPLVLGEHLSVASAAELAQEIRGALDIGEEKSDGACRQLAHGRRSYGM